MMPPLFNLIIDLYSLTRVPALEWPGALLAWSVRWDASVDWRCLLGRNTVAIQCRDARSPSTIWICDFARDKRCQWRRDGERCGCSQMLTRRSWQPILLISTARVNFDGPATAYFCHLSLRLLVQISSC